MSEAMIVNAQVRSDEGKGASRRLRHQGLIPGIVYGGNKKPEMITLSHQEMLLHLEHEAFYSSILELDIDKKKQQVILKDLQRHPAKPFVLHVDFQRVSATQTLKTRVPIHFVGEDVCPGLKLGGGVSHHMTDVEISCLPKDLPEFLQIDMSKMVIGDSVHLSEIELPEGVEIPSLAQGVEQHDMVVVNIHSGHGDMDMEEETEEGVEGEAPAEDAAESEAAADEEGDSKE
jgi:large subunit ribosomal protein L25